MLKAFSFERKKSSHINSNADLLFIDNWKIFKSLIAIQSSDMQNFSLTSLKNCEDTGFFNIGSLQKVEKNIATSQTSSFRCVYSTLRMLSAFKGPDLAGCKQKLVDTKSNWKDNRYKFFQDRTKAALFCSRF